jgi:CDP-glucose 4,6-dehydratase
LFGDRYRNRRVLLTGHTGFKGSWLALWLKNMGANVTGLALAPETAPSHWDLLKLGIPEKRVDVRDNPALARMVAEARPEIVFHLAAQSLVRRSYRVPLETWDTNVMGTANLLEACRSVPGLQAIVVVTTDKCYENKESRKGYKEEDRLGGHDPYSASKAATELVVASYRDSFYNQPASALVATARAGNVIGGGDWCEDRIIPDLVRAQQRGEELSVRSPNATRPWQHVLEPLSGYLQLGQGLLEGKKEFQGPWNFGPDDTGALTVADLLDRLKPDWPGLSWHAAPGASKLHETTMLQLDSTKARKQLKWKPALTTAQQLAMTAEWYSAYLKNGSVLSAKQLEAYQKAAMAAKVAWA